MNLTSCTHRFDASLADIRLARVFASGVSKGAGCSQVVNEAVALIVGELAANAVLHAASPFTVSVHTHTDRVDVGVTDQSPGTPKITPVGSRVTGGRGLVIVGSLSLSWGVRPEATGGKTVWAAVDTCLSG